MSLHKWTVFWRQLRLSLNERATTFISLSDFCTNKRSCSSITEILCIGHAFRRVLFLPVVHRLATFGPAVSAPRTSLLKIRVFFSRMQKFVRYRCHTKKSPSVRPSCVNQSKFPALHNTANLEPLTVTLQPGSSYQVCYSAQPYDLTCTARSKSPYLGLPTTR